MFPNLVKTTRKSLQAHRLHIENEIVDWADIVKLYHSTHEMRLRLAPKLTERHIWHMRSPMLLTTLPLIMLLASLLKYLLRRLHKVVVVLTCLGMSTVTFMSHISFLWCLKRTMSQASSSATLLCHQAQLSHLFSSSSHTFVLLLEV